jgi:hypothetical protein
MERCLDDDGTDGDVFLPFHLLEIPSQFAEVDARRNLNAREQHAFRARSPQRGELLELFEDSCDLFSQR